MADSQIMCMDDGHINEKINESNAEFYYSEEQRAALEQLLTNGDGAFKERLKEDKTIDFLSAREVKSIRSTFKEYITDSDDDQDSAPSRSSKADSGIHSTYWPQLSDIEVPLLDIGWPDGGTYKGVTRVVVHMNPPKENGPRVKQVVRKLIQEASKVVAVVMDLLTDPQILQDLLDAAYKRKVSVYILLDASGMPHFLDMCTRLQVSAVHLRSIRVRTVRGIGLPLASGKLPGSLSNKYMLVDGDKVIFGTYSFTWSSSRIDRNTMLLMTGHVVDSFDQDFRELYAISESVDLYGELNIAKEPTPKTALPKLQLQPPASTNLFKVSLGDLRDLKTEIPAHKYYNPKYSLVVGGPLAPARSLQDISSIDQAASVAPDSLLKVPKAISERPDRPVSLHTSVPASPTGVEGKGSGRTPNGLTPTGKKPNLWRLFKAKTANLNIGGKDKPSSEAAVEKLGDNEASAGAPQIKARALRGSRASINTQEGDAPKTPKHPQKEECIIS